jgi:hypothetical protein
MIFLYFLKFLKKKLLETRRLHFCVRGSTTLEYSLILLAVIVMTLAIAKRVRDFMIGSGECPNETMICRVLDQITGTGGPLNPDGGFRYYRLKQ